METIPPETTEHIFKFVDASALAKIIPKVCSQWKKIAGRVLEEKITNMLDYFSTINPQLFQEIKVHLHPSEHENNQKILEMYEKAFLKKAFQIKNKRLG